MARVLSPRFSLCFILHPRLLKLRPHLRLQAAQTVFFPVHELPRLGERRMNGLNLAPHLLADETIIGMTPGHGAQLAHMNGFAQVHLHVSADLVGERHGSLADAVS